MRTGPRVNFQKEKKFTSGFLKLFLYNWKVGNSYFLCTKIFMASPELPASSPELPTFSVIMLYESTPRQLERADFGEPLEGEIFCEECESNGIGQQGGIPRFPGLSGPIELLKIMCYCHYRQSGGEHKPGIIVYRSIEEQGVTEEQVEEIISTPPSSTPPSQPLPTQLIP